MVAQPIPGLEGYEPDWSQAASAAVDLRTHAQRVAKQRGVPEDVLLGVLGHESGLDPKAYGNGGGVGQFIESTARSYGTTQAELRANPKKAVELAAQLLKDNADQFGGDFDKAAAAYFIGPGNVSEAERQGGANWLAAADQLARKYNQGTVSSYLSSVHGGAGASAGTGIPADYSAPSGAAAGGSVMRAMLGDTAQGSRPSVSEMLGNAREQREQELEALTTVEPLPEITPPRVGDAGLAMLGAPDQDVGTTGSAAGGLLGSSFGRPALDTAPSGFAPDAVSGGGGGGGGGALAEEDQGSSFLGGAVDLIGRPLGFAANALTSPFRPYSPGGPGGPPLPPPRSTLGDAATTGIAPLEAVSDLSERAFAFGGNALEAPFRPFSPGGPGGPAPRAPGPGYGAKVGGLIGGSLFPTTPLEVGLTLAPEVPATVRALRSGARIAPELASLATRALIPGLQATGREAPAGVAAVIGDAGDIRRKAAQAAKQLEVLRAAGYTDEDVIQSMGREAFDLAQGGAVSQRAAQGVPDIQGQATSQAWRNEYERVLEDTGSEQMAQDAARRAAGAEAGATTGLRSRAAQMAERMAPPPGALGIVEGEGGAAAVRGLPDARVDYSKLTEVPSLKANTAPDSNGFIRVKFGWMSPDGVIRELSPPNQHWDALVGMKGRDSLGNAEAVNELLADGWVRMTRTPEGTLSLQSEAGDVLQQVRQASVGAPAARTKLFVDRGVEHYSGTVRDFLSDPPAWAGPKNRDRLLTDVVGAARRLGNPQELLRERLFGGREGGVTGEGRQPNPALGEPMVAMPDIKLTRKLPALAKTVDEAVGELQPPPAGEPKGFLTQPPPKAKVVVAVHNQANLDAVGPISNNGQRVGNMWVGGLPSPSDWAAMALDSASVQQIMKWSRYYKDNAANLRSLFQVATPEEADKYRSAFVRGNVRTSSERAAMDVFRIEERQQGVIRAGEGSMNATSIGNALKGSADPEGVGPKISDFDDAFLGKKTRTWAQDDPRAESPFVADTHTSRDAGFIDSEMERYIKQKTGKGLEELGLQYDQVPVPGGSNGFVPTEVQYELVSRWGNNLTRELNAMGDGAGWLGKNDWTTEEVQAIGWGRVRKELGLEDSGFETIRDANTRMLSFPAVAKGLTTRAAELGPEGLRRVTDRYVDNMIAAVKQNIPQARITKVAGEGLAGARYDVAGSPETMDEIALALAHQTEGPVHVYRREPKGKDFHIDLVPERPLTHEEIQNITEAANGLSRGVTYAEAGGLRIFGVPKSEEGQQALLKALDAASGEVSIEPRLGRGTLSVVGEGGSHADALETLRRTRPDAAGALQPRDPLRERWLDAALEPGDWSRTPTGAAGAAGGAGALPPATGAPSGALGIVPGEGNLGQGATRAAQTPRDRLLLDTLGVAKRLGNPQEMIRRRLMGEDEGPGPGVARNQPAQPQLPGMPAPPAPARGAVGQLVHELTSLPGGLIGGMRTGFASGDLPVMRQGGVLAWSHPQQTLGAFKKALQVYDPLGDGSTLAAHQAAREADPLYQQARDAKLHFREAGAAAAPGTRAPDYDWMNDSFISKLQQKMPWIKGSERSTVEFLNDLGFETWKAETDALRAAGVSDPKRYEAVADVVNHALGHSGSGVAEKFGAINALFSAQYTASRFNILADPFVHWNNPEARQLAIKNLMSMAGGNAAMLGLMAVTGEGTGRWSVNLNPTSGDFGQVRVGNTRYDTLAGFGPMIKTAARVEEDIRTGKDPQEVILTTVADLTKYFENKESPFVKMWTDAYVHKKVPSVTDMLQNYIPGLATGMVEAATKNEGLTNKVVNVAGAGLLGSVSVGANTYQTGEDQADVVSQQTYPGRKYADLGPLEQARVISELPEDARKQVQKTYNEGLKERKTAAGYDNPSAVKAQLDRDNPVIDAADWLLHGGTVQTKEAAELTLRNGAVRDVRLPGMDRAINQDDNSRRAWDDTGSMVDFYINGMVQAVAPVEIAERGKKDKAFLDASGKPKAFNQLTSSQRSTITSGIHDAARESGQLEAVLWYWGLVETPDKKHLPQVQAIISKYGARPENPFAAAVTAGVKATAGVR